jgi:predicted cupin superfamily sugar epimerase
MNVTLRGERRQIMDEAKRVIAELGLAPHPEGGWYRETWRAAAEPGARAGGTAILFLLEAGQRSHWHRVDADELWFWHRGSAIDLLLADSDAGPVRTLALGARTQLQGLAPAGCWQAAVAHDGWALVSCVVVPGFEFSGFELAAPDWAPGSE